MKKFSTKVVLFAMLSLFFTTVSAQNCAVNAGVDQTICVTSPLNLTGIAGMPQSSPAVTLWTQISGPTTVTFGTPNVVNTSVTGYAPGNYVFQLSNKCSDNLLAKDLVVVTVLPEPPTALAGVDITQCSNTSVPLNANAVTAPNVGTWTVSPAGGTFSPNANAPNATYTPPAGAATYTLTWTISNGICTKADNMLVNVVSPTTPINAGTDITLSCGGSCVTLNGSNPGLTPPQGGFWSLISGPNTPVITNATLRNTTVCGLVPGSYTLRWTVSGSCGSGQDDMVINVSNINNAPTNTGATYDNFCNTPATNTQTLTGSPLTPGETGVWTLTSGQAGVTYSPNTTSANVTVGNLTGTFAYTFNWVKTNTATGCATTATHTINRASTISSLSNPADQELACDITATTFTLSYTASPTFLNSGLTRTAIRISGPAAVGTAAYVSGTGTGSRTETWNATGLTTPGTYVFRIEYNNSCGSQFRDIAITTSKTPGAVNAGSDITLPCNTRAANPIGSSASIGAGYTLQWTQVSGPNTAALTTSNTLSLGMSGLIQGVYRMRLNVSGGAKCPSKSDDMLVKVTTAVPTIATAGGNATICAGNIRLTGNTPGPLETGTWTVTPSAGVSFTPNANTPNAYATGLAANTTYTFTWTISNPCGSVFATQVLTTTNVQGPPIPNAQPDQCVTAGTTTVNLPGSNPGVGNTITWSALDAGSSVSPTNTQNTVATITGGNGSYKFVYALSKAGCTTLTDTVTVTVAPTVIANAGADISICASTLPASTSLSATAPPVGSTGEWSQISGPTTAVLATPNAANTAVNSLEPGVYEFEYRIKSGICPEVADIVQVRVTQSPSTANAGPDQSLCNVTSATIVTLAGNVPSAGSGYWQVVSGPAGSPTPNFSNQNINNSTVSNLSNGTYSLVWTIFNGPGCPATTDTVVLNIVVAAFAKPDFSTCNVTTATLTGNANTTGTWTYVSATPAPPSTPTLAANSSNTAVVSSLATGVSSPITYTFRYTLPVVGACPSTFDDVVVTNYPQPSQSNAGADVELCFNQNTVTLTGNTPVAGTGLWVRESGPNTPTAGIANAGYQDTTLNNIIPGLYLYRYEVNTNSACIASVDKVQIVKEITANAKPDIRVCNATSVNLNATPAVINTGTWTQVSGPSAGVFSNVNAPNASVSSVVPGTYKFEWRIAGPGACAVNKDTVEVIIDPAVPPMNAGLDTTFCQGTVNPFTIGTAAQGGVTYSWTPASLLSNASIAQPQFTGVNNAGTYTYTVKGAIGTCEAFDQVNIVVKPKPITSFSLTSPACNGVFTPATVVGGNTYNWDFGSTANPATASTAGPHSVTWITPGSKTVKLIVTSANGCIDSTTITFNPTCVLPITLTKFNAAWKSNIPQLTWHVENAINFKNFVVERSFDGIHFNSIATVNYVNSQADYEYFDNSLINISGKIFYRLILVDIGSRTTNSEIKSLLAVQKSDVAVYPNPFLNTVDVTLNVLKNEEKVELALYTADGRLLLTKQSVLKRGNNNIELNNLSKFSNGVYFLKITREDGVSTRKLLKN